MSRRFASVLIACLMAMGSIALLSSAARAVDEQKALSLLVDSLGRVDDAATQSALLRGMLAGLAGRRDVPPPEAWSQVAAKLAKSEDRRVRELASELSQLFGDKTATQRAVNLVRDHSKPTAARRRALYSLLNQKRAEVSPLLEALLAEPELRVDAIRGYAAIEHPQASKILLARYKQWPAELRKAVIETLATRKQYAESLLAAIKDQRVSRDEVPAHVARSLDFLLGDEFRMVFGDIRQLSTDRTSQINKFKRILTAEALENADAGKGRVVYQKTCATCHVLYGVGGKIGPDLTGSNRANIDYLLLNSVDPSYDVPEGYKMVTIQTTDGRVLNGVVAEEDGQRVVLKTVEQPRVIVLKSDIESRRISPKSMMPEGQLDKMKPQQIIDLVKYLQTSEQVEAAE